MNRTILIILAIIFMAYISYRTIRLITLDNGLKAKLENGAIILDVRTPMEYESDHIRGSINMPLGAIRKRYRELDPSRCYITTCSHGLRSIKVEQLLKQRGFKEVYNGGAWVDLEQIINYKK